MCRLFGFRGLHATQLSFFLVNAENSMAKQSELDSREIPNHDGWGIGFYQYGKGYVQKRATCAKGDFNFMQLSDFIHTDAMIAHVRDATVGQNSDYNAHPFQYLNWIGAHNGTIASFDKLKPFILEKIGHEIALNIKGTTDSETLFHLFVAILSEKVVDITNPDVPVEMALQALTETLNFLNDLRAKEGVQTSHKLNLMVTNGKIMLASCYGNTLFYTRRKECLDNDIKLYKDDFSLKLNMQDDKHNESVVIASEIIENFDSWAQLKDGQVISVDKDLNTALYELQKDNLPV